MSKYLIRFNKSRGQPGRGSEEHVWRVFENEQEFLVKSFSINVRTSSEKEVNSDEWNLVCYGFMEIHKEDSHIIINSTNKE